MPRRKKTQQASSREAESEESEEIAILSDIHGNLDAFEAVLTECERRGVSKYRCLGDIVGYGAHPAQCVRLAQALACPTVVGNHDFCVGTGEIDNRLNEAARAGIEYAIKQLTRSARKWLAQLPQTIQEAAFTIVHASLDEPLRWDYILSAEEASPTLNLQKTPLCFYGHTHVPQFFTQGSGTPAPALIGEEKYRFHQAGRSLINPGSVGQPRGGDPRAQFAIFDPTAFTVEFVAVEYNIEAAARAIIKAGLPPYLALRLMEGL